MGSDDLDLTVEEAIHALSRAASRLDVSTTAATRGVVDSETALEMIASLERFASLAPQLRHDAGGQDAGLLLREGRASLLAAERSRQRSKLTLMTRQIARLRAAQTVEDLARSIPIETAGLGYERSLFSWVENERWVPQSAHSVSNPQQAKAMVAAGGPPYQEIRSLNEVVVIRERRPILIHGAADSPRVHPGIIPVTRSVTYAASPVIARGRVVGMVHVDRNLETGLTDDFDRDLLAAYSESIGAMLDRLLTTGTDASPHPEDLDADWSATLTEREREVLDLVAEGLSNAEISARLYVSPETTKSHLRKLMRKMGVNTRSRAAALYRSAV